MLEDVPNPSWRIPSGTVSRGPFAILMLELSNTYVTRNTYRHDEDDDDGCVIYKEPDNIESVDPVYWFCWLLRHSESPVAPNIPSPG